MMTVIICYAVGSVITFFLIAMLRGCQIMDSEVDSVGALVAAIAWPFTLMALIGFVTLWWLFDVLELFFYAVVTHFRSRK